MLGVQEGASMHEIKVAYRKLVLRYHPDKNISKQDVEKFKLITEAYGILRSKHDISSSNHTVGSKQYYQDSLCSKILYWTEMNLEKFIKEWFFDSRYTEKTYRNFCKCEQEYWKYCEKMAQIAAATVFSSIASGCKVQSLHNLYGRALSLKKGLKNLQSKLKL